MNSAEHDTTIRAGSLLCFSTGEYSDYGYEGHFVALEDIPREIMVNVAERVTAERKDDWKVNPHQMFISALIKEGLLLAVTCTELHIGSYGRLEVPV